MNQNLYLELYFRGENDDRPDERPVNLEVVYCWWEGLYDMHIQLACDREVNLYPEYCKATGDYVLPVDQWLTSHLKFTPQIVKDYKWTNRKARKNKIPGALVYSMGFNPKPTLDDGGVIAPDHYQELVFDCWASPNRSNDA